MWWRVVQTPCSALSKSNQSKREGEIKVEKKAKKKQKKAKKSKKSKNPNQTANLSELPARTCTSQYGERGFRCPGRLEQPSAPHSRKTARIFSLTLHQRRMDGAWVKGTQFAVSLSLGHHNSRMESWCLGHHANVVTLMRPRADAPYQQRRCHVPHTTKCCHTRRCSSTDPLLQSILRELSSTHPQDTRHSSTQQYKNSPTYTRRQCTVHSTQYTVPYTVPYTVHSTQYTVHSTQYTVHSTQYTVHSAQYTVHSSQYTAHSTEHSRVLTPTLAGHRKVYYALCTVGKQRHAQRSNRKKPGNEAARLTTQMVCGVWCVAAQREKEERMEKNGDADKHKHGGDQLIAFRCTQA
jgi:hypothetical protein